MEPIDRSRGVTVWGHCSAKGFFQETSSHCLIFTRIHASLLPEPDPSKKKSDQNMLLPQNEISSQKLRVISERLTPRHKERIERVACDCCSLVVTPEIRIIRIILRHNSSKQCLVVAPHAIAAHNCLSSQLNPFKPASKLVKRIRLIF